MPLNGGLLSSEEVHVRQSPGPLLGRSSQRRHRRATFTLSLAFDVMNFTTKAFRTLTIHTTDKAQATASLDIHTIQTHVP